MSRPTPHVPALALAVALLAGSAPGTAAAQAWRAPLDLPDSASRALPRDLDLTGLTYREAFRLLAGEPFLDVNLVLSADAPGLDRRIESPLRGLTAGELVRLLLQLSETRLRRAGRRTWVLVDADDPRRFGVSRTTVVRPLRVLPSRVLDFVRESPDLAAEIPVERITADDDRGTLFLIASPEEVAALRRVVRHLDGQGDALWARIPVSHIDGDALAAHLETLGAAERERLPSWTYAEAPRFVVARGDAPSLERLQTLVRALDRPRGQVRVSLWILEVTRETLRRLGVDLDPTRVRVEALDALARGRVTPSRVGGVLHFLLRDSGSETLGYRTLVALDGEPASIQLGQIRNVRTLTVRSTFPGQSTVGSNVTEVPLGFQLTLTPTVHHDGTATLEIDLADERPLAVLDFGVDRETFAFQTRVRARYGVPLLLTGFDDRLRSRTAQGTSAAERRGLGSRQVLLLRVDPDPAAAPTR